MKTTVYGLVKNAFRFGLAHLEPEIQVFKDLVLSSISNFYWQPILTQPNLLARLTQLIPFPPHLTSNPIWSHLSISFPPHQSILQGNSLLANYPILT